MARADERERMKIRHRRQRPSPPLPTPTPTTTLIIQRPSCRPMDLSFPTSSIRVSILVYLGGRGVDFFLYEIVWSIANNKYPPNLPTTRPSVHACFGGMNCRSLPTMGTLPGDYSSSPGQAATCETGSCVEGGADKVEISYLCPCQSNPSFSPHFFSLSLLLHYD